MPWREFFIPLDENDPRNADRLEPGGERICFRLNRQGNVIVDYVIQYETPTLLRGHGHATVVRSDGSHAPHYDVYDRFGGTTTETLDPNLSAADAINWTIEDIKRRWPMMRQRFFDGLRERP
jgi:hypothetical protein